MSENFLLYKSDSGEVRLEVLLQDETVWLTQKALAQLFGKDRSVITKHLKNIFKSGELQEKQVCAFFTQTTQHGAIADKTQTKEVKFYNLDAVPIII